VPLFALLASWIGFVLLPPNASARAYTLDLEAGYAVSRALGETGHGGVIAGRFYAGVTDYVLVGGAARFDAGSGIVGGFVGASALFRLDVVQWVPFATIDAGVRPRVWRTVPGSGGADLEVSAGLGVDYLRSRSLALGAVARYHLAATSLSEQPAFVTICFRVSFRWE
jgi:hypothetical protein